MDFLFGGALAVMAFVAAMVMVACVACVLHWGHDREEGLMPYIFYPVVLVLILDTLFSGRNLYTPLILHDEPLPKHPLVTLITNLTAVFFALAAVERIGRRFLRYGRKPDNRTMLIAAFCAYFLTNYVTSALLGTHPSFAMKYVYWALVTYGALLFTEKGGDTAIRCARNALLIFLALSALCAPFRPELVFGTGYHSALILPGLNVRYAGLSSHANTLGPLVITFLLCVWSRPYSTRWFNLLAWALGMSSLVLTQSKTSWLAFAVCACFLIYFRHEGRPRQSAPDFRRALLPVTLWSGALLAAITLSLALMFGNAVERIESFTHTRAGHDLITLVGRDLIWEVAMEEWRNNPLFGYGLTIWNDDHRAVIGIPAAKGAHNEFYESLARAGIVGAAGLVVYTATLLWFVLRTAKPTRGLSLALFAMLFIRAFTEVPLSMESFPSQLIHLLLLMVVASGITLAGTRSRPAGSEGAFATEKSGA